MEASDWLSLVSIAVTVLLGLGTLLAVQIGTWPVRTRRTIRANQDILKDLPADDPQRRNLETYIDRQLDELLTRRTALDRLADHFWLSGAIVLLVNVPQMAITWFDVEHPAVEPRLGLLWVSTVWATLAFVFSITVMIRAVRRAISGSRGPAGPVSRARRTGPTRQVPGPQRRKRRLND